MPIPQLLADIVRFLIQLSPAMALVCLVLAGIALPLEGGSTFQIGGGFSKWILWGIIMLTLPQLLLWFSFFWRDCSVTVQRHRHRMVGRIPHGYRHFH
jgi:hypothetical protein